MGKITIRDLYDYAKSLSSPSPLLGALNFDTDWAAAYNAAFARLDRNFGKTLGCFEPLENLPDLDDIADVYDEWVGDVDAVLFKMQANLDQLWKATVVDYNPIENYDKHAEITDQESGSDSITKILGIQNNQDNWGAVNRTMQYGAQTTRDIMAAKTNSEINPLKRSSETLKTNAANAGETWKDKKEYAEEAYTTSVEEGAHTDSHETDLHSDSDNTAARADTHIIGGRNDSDTTQYGKKVVHTEHIHGDIGVLTPDAMLGGHWNAWTNVVKFFDAMMYMIISELCTLSEEVRV